MQIFRVLQAQTYVFAWEYSNMKDSHPNIYTHQIYFDHSNHVNQVPTRVNPNFKDIMKIEIKNIKSRFYLPNFK